MKEQLIFTFSSHESLADRERGWTDSDHSIPISGIVNEPSEFHLKDTLHSTRIQIIHTVSYLAGLSGAAVIQMTFEGGSSA